MVAERQDMGHDYHDFNIWLMQTPPSVLESTIYEVLACQCQQCGCRSPATKPLDSTGAELAICEDCLVGWHWEV
jgi:hypothetical protein